MKKLLLCLVGVLVLTGCGSKAQTLECEITQTDEGMEMKQVIKANFEGSTVKKADMIHYVTVDESMVEYIDMFKEAFETEFKESEDFKDAEVEVTSKDNVITVSVLLDEEDLKNFSSSEFQIKEDYNTTKEQMEAEGYTCK